MSVSGSIGKLKQAGKDLQSQWREVQNVWRDDNAQRFEERFLVPLFARLRRVDMAMGHMASILQKARRDCE